MRIETGDRYEWRLDLYDDVAQLLDESARSKAIDGACEFTRRMHHNLERAVDHPDMTPELAELLSTPEVPVRYEVRTDVGHHE